MAVDEVRELYYIYVFCFSWLCCSIITDDDHDVSSREICMIDYDMIEMHVMDVLFAFLLLISVMLFTLLVQLTFLLSYLRNKFSNHNSLSSSNSGNAWPKQHPFHTKPTSILAGRMKVRRTHPQPLKRVRLANCCRSIGAKLSISTPQNKHSTMDVH